CLTSYSLSCYARLVPRDLPSFPTRRSSDLLNIGLGEAVANGRALDAAVGDLATITGQKPVVTRAKKSVASFKVREGMPIGAMVRSEEHTSELQSRFDLVCRLLLEKKKKKKR